MIIETYDKSGNIINSKKQELLPCPFCGKKPRILLGKKKYDQLHGDPYQDFILKCCIISSEFISKDRALEVWNKRISGGGV